MPSFAPPPTLSTPLQHGALAGIATPLTRFALSGAGNDGVTVALSISTGLLIADPAPGATVIGAGSASLLISGTIDQVNAKLASLAVLAAQPGTGILSLSILDPMGRRIDATSVAIPIYATEAPSSPLRPVISFSSGTLAISAQTVSGVTVNLVSGRSGDPAPSLVLVGSILAPDSSLAILNVPARVAIGSDVTWAGTVTVSGADAAITLAQGATLDNSGVILLSSGAATVTGPGILHNDGTIEVGGGTPKMVAEISGHGAVIVDPGAVLSVQGAISAEQTIDLNGALDLKNPSNMKAQIENFSDGDSITIHGAVIDHLSYEAINADQGVLIVTSGGQTVARLALVGRYGPNSFQVTQAADALDPTARITVRTAAAQVSSAADSNTRDVYRFFDRHLGTEFLTQDTQERDTILQTRPDLGYEGVAMRAFASPGADPNTVPVYRFFDIGSGTHFFTASASERDQTLANRPDLVWEQGATLYEHATPASGDVAVYRYFDTQHGSHFFTSDQGERNAIAATRPDLHFEGIAFYAPT